MCCTQVGDLPSALLRWLVILVRPVKARNWPVDQEECQHLSELQIVITLNLIDLLRLRY
jgi:hypothetical protein